MKVQKLNWRQARSVLYLSRFDFMLKYMLGVRMGKADRLSRRLDLGVEVEKNNENQKLIKEEWIKGMIEVVVEGPEIMLVEKMKRAREKDEEVVKVVEKMKKVEVKVLRRNKWKTERELVLIYLQLDMEGDRR